jgi:hypothetical protein
MLSSPTNYARNGRGTASAVSFLTRTSLPPNPNYTTYQAQIGGCATECTVYLFAILLIRLHQLKQSLGRFPHTHIKQLIGKLLL